MFIIEKGDEVITTNFSFASTIEVILLLGLKPILVDIDPKTFNIDPTMIEKRITNKTRAIIPVHLYGQSCRMNEIMEIAKRNKLFVIEDNAQALGSKVKLSNSTIGPLIKVADLRTFLISLLTSDLIFLY